MLKHLNFRLYIKNTITVFLSKLQFLTISLKNYPFKGKMEVTG